MICFLRCAPVNADIRLKKYIQACQSRDINFFALTWDRLGEGTQEIYEIQWGRFAPYGQRWKNLINKILWQFFILKNLIKHKSEYKVIHATNLENILPALIMKLLLKKRVIYDIYDSSSSDFSKSLFTSWLRKLDIFCIKKSDLLILADKKRLKQINVDSSIYKSFMDIENVPNFSDYVVSKNTLDFRLIKLSYVGVFDPLRGLEELLNFVSKNEGFVLNIAGSGTLLEKVKEYSLNNSRITYHGTVKYEDGLDIMRGSDFIIGMYYKKASNHIYAAPNKFFEALYLAKPLITTNGTLVGDKVAKYMTGYALEEGESEISDFFEKCIRDKEIFISEYEIICKNAADLWNSSYSNYFENRLKNDYVNFIISLK
ncbi:hypothetical protein [Mucilaginibacter sp. UR6-11]|uniref:hypothetical protein n=1 Tax=Mucilaginibacter sp. UR6-11 TaxID=1435644 RepID=UPI001E4E17BC|nr:hypothetical protein [Mucilaginibacter sp. UR6-11]MCC8424862.1 hypothetical protein [Mucilaginibacter sp. UR6-11]